MSPLLLSYNQRLTVSQVSSRLRRNRTSLCVRISTRRWKRTSNWDRESKKCSLTTRRQESRWRKRCEVLYKIWRMSQWDSLTRPWLSNKWYPMALWCLHQARVRASWAKEETWETKIQIQRDPWPRQATNRKSRRRCKWWDCIMSR